jgi:hypothetical protein
MYQVPNLLAWKVKTQQLSSKSGDEKWDKNSAKRTPSRRQKWGDQENEMSEIMGFCPEQFLPVNYT